MKAMEMCGFSGPPLEPIVILDSVEYMDSPFTSVKSIPVDRKNRRFVTDRFF
jgi:hypothetical protein